MGPNTETAGAQEASTEKRIEKCADLAFHSINIA
jgi:hypothetical protein